ncbi:MAG TPA: 5,10-methylene tetrahydromethanopterin reductase [Gammaproteobacteria bacterium]|nr:5,10-methylene tetrahydromethanopterin reductase [Gammaproteobacteria bacterium]
MRMGAILSPLADASNPTSLADQARSYEEIGFSSLWVVQAIGRGFIFTDPLIALSVAATVTERVSLGTAVLQLPLYRPMDLAHRVFSLQQICGERLILGVGAGSTEQDFIAYGVKYEDRFKILNAALADLREIFASGGLEESNLSPWDTVIGGPPIYLGSWGAGVKRAAQEFDGWIASANYRTVDEVTIAAEEYKKAGGGPSVISTIQVSRKTDLGELKENLGRFAEAGFDEAVVMIHASGPSPEKVLALLK